MQQGLSVCLLTDIVECGTDFKTHRYFGLRRGHIPGGVAIMWQSSLDKNMTPLNFNIDCLLVSKCSLVTRFMLQYVYICHMSVVKMKIFIYRIWV